MDKKRVEKLCRVLGDVIAIAIPIIVTTIVNDSKEEFNEESK